jgi:hypothetical protein
MCSIYLILENDREMCQQLIYQELSYYIKNLKKTKCKNKTY